MFTLLRFLHVRNVVLWLARKLGSFLYWLRSEWRPPLFWLVVTAISVWLVEHLVNPQSEPWFQGSNFQIPYSLLTGIGTLFVGIWLQWWKILALYTLVWLLWWAWQARKRVVVEDFVDYTSDQPKAAVEGLATLLVVRLGQLRELYQNVDEQRAIPTSVWINESVDATIKVGDISEFLKDAVTAQSKFSLGPLEIPVGTLMSLFGRFVQGPRIIGSLHEDKNLRILIAQRVGGGKQSHSWRVERLMPIGQSEDQDDSSLNSMVAELTCRMFTDLALSGSVRWEAMSKFSEGLRAYRDCLRTPKDRKLKLKEAEKKFIETLAQDQKFYLAYYNLGVVYTELGQVQAAEVAFSKAINQNPGSWNAYYALALSRFQRIKKEQKGKSDQQDESAKTGYESIIELCKRVIALKPGLANTAKAYQARGMAHSELKDPKNQRGAIRCHRKAVARSWRALYLAGLKGQGLDERENSVIPQLEVLASVCLANLAVTYRDRHSLHQNSVTSQGRLRYEGMMIRDRFVFHRVLALLQQALYLNNSDADYHAYYNDKLAEMFFELGETYKKLEKYDKAVREYKRALRVNPGKIEFWTSSALANATLYAASKFNNPDKAEVYKSSALYACEKVLECPSQVPGDILEKMIEAYKELDKSASSDYVASIKQFLDQEQEIRKLEELKKKGQLQDLELGRMLKERLEWCSRNNNEEWRYALISLALGRLYINSKQREIVSEVEKHFKEAIDKLNVLIVRLDELIQKDAERGEWECGQVYSKLGSLHLVLHKPEEAEKCFREAINKLKKYPREIRTQKLKLSLASSLLEGSTFISSQEIERDLLLDPRAYDERKELGILYFELNEFEQAIEILKEVLLWRNALLTEPEDPEIYLYIGRAYLGFVLHERDFIQRGRILREASEHFRQALALYKSDQQQREESRFALGYLNIELGEYEQAIAYFRVCQAHEFSLLSSTFYLGYAYLKNKEYDEGLQQFQFLLKQAGELVNISKGVSRTKLNEIKEYSANMTLGEYLATAYWGQAYIYAERDVNLKQALKFIQKARNYIRLVDETLVQYPAYYPDCEGWVLYKLGKIDNSIEHLEQAVALVADAEEYLHLALAFEQKLQKSKERDKIQLIARVRKHCQHVQELDIKKEYEQQVKEILSRLEEKGR